MSDQFWMVYGVGQKEPTHRHASRRAALAEAERLARYHVGVTFVVLEAVCAVVKSEVRTAWLGAHRADPDDGIPF